MSDVKRYRLSYRFGVIEEDGSPVRSADTSEPMVLAAAHDKLVGELRLRIAVLEAAVCNEIPKLERLESWLQIQRVASPSAKTTALRDAAQYSLRDLRDALQPKDPTS